MSKYIVICDGREGLRHDRCQVGWIDDNRDSGGGVEVFGANGFEQFKQFEPNRRGGQTTCRLRCSQCPRKRNVFWSESTLVDVMAGNLPLSDVV